MAANDGNREATVVTHAEVRALRNALRFGKTRIPAHLDLGQEADFRALLVAFFSRATTTSEALALLIEQGFSQQAMMLNRAVFELMVDSYWTEANREIAEENFVKHARFQQHLQRERFSKHPSFLDEPLPTERLGEEELAELGCLYGHHGVRSWTGRGMHRRVEDIVEVLQDPSEREQLRRYRDLIHSLDNQELHPSPWSLARVLRRVPADGGDERWQWRMAPEAELGQFAVRCAWWVYLQLLHLLISTFQMPLEEALEQLKEDAPWDRTS